MSRAAEPSVVPTSMIEGIAVLDADGPGTPVVLVPGFTGSKEDFGPVVGQLGRRTVAMDLPGQYESPGPDDPSGYSTTALAARVLDVVRALGGRAHLVGHSFGGLVCRAAALQDPSAVASLVLLCSGPGAIPEPRRWDIELLVQGTPGRTMSEVWDAVTAFRTAQGEAAPSEFAALRWQRSTAEGLVGMGRAVLDEPDGIGYLVALRIPAVVMTGELDDAWPVAVQADMAARLGCEQVIITGGAHSPAIEAPGETVAALRAWLGDRDLAGGP